MEALPVKAWQWLKYYTSKLILLWCADKINLYLVFGGIGHIWRVRYLIESEAKTRYKVESTSTAVSDTEL